MTYGIGISFPKLPTKKDVKDLRKQVAHDMFGVVDGGKAKSKPVDKPAVGRDKTKPAGKKD
ncbi:MAG: hypothetical protein H0Z35_09170 [Thermoanaerobacteraceae bacterium]|nr:hypothetical protein [Thermoanaerobacteraceae bacterium]